MILSALMLAALQPPAVADTEMSDLRCFVVFAAMLGRAEGEDRANAMGAAFYFFGRVDSRIRSDELEARIAQEARTLAAADMPAILRECGTFMQTRGRALIEIGSRIQAGERAGDVH